MTTLLEVNLKNKNIEKKSIPNLRKNFLGGVGINTKLLFDMVPKNQDPLGAQNVLVFGVGSLVGTALPTACRTEVSSKSPLSGLFGTTNAGGKWGTRLSRAGILHVLIREKSLGPVYLVIDNDNIFLENADDLWGLDCYEATSLLQKTHGKEFSIAVIGPAGEKQVKYASIQNDYHASWGRTGMGAVMGSKNLKAVIVRGSNKLEVQDPGTLSDLKREALQRIKGDPSFGPTRKYGSMVASDPFNEIGCLPAYNFTSGSIATWEKTLSRKVFENKYKERDIACFSCPVACAHWSKVKEKGDYEGYETKGLEITFVLEFGAKLGLTYIPEIFKCVEICNRHGMDVVSASGSVAYLINSYKKGYFKKEQIGFSIDYGDFSGIYRLLDMTGKREGIGDLLAEGVKKMCEKYPNTKNFAVHIKGVELPGRDPRAKMDVWSLGYLTNTRGGDHLRARSPVEKLKGTLKDHKTEELGVSLEHIEDMDMPKNLKNKIFSDPPTGVNIPAMTVYAENLITIINSVGFCIRPPILRSLGPGFYARAMNALYGDSFTENSIYDVANNIYNLQHSFNSREGSPLSPSDLSFPSCFYNKNLPAKDGFHPPLNAKEVQEMVREYLEYRDIIN